MITIVTTNNETETMNEGKKLGRILKPGMFVALHGGLGAGKTVFARGVAAGLGIKMNVSSPTFTIVNEYPGYIPLFHFDMYRIENTDELFEIGWEDYLERGGVCIVEWSGKIRSALPPDTIDVHIENPGDDVRILRIEGKGVSAYADTGS